MAQGQGNPLPPNMKLDGEWIIENVAFLYYTNEVASEATFTIGQAKEDGTFAIGFDAAQLAAEFGIDVSSLLQANQSEMLVFVGTKDTAPTHGGISATEYVFGIGERRAILISETYQQEGNA